MEMTVKTRYEITARRYSQLYEIAEQSLEQYHAIQKLTQNFEKEISKQDIHTFESLIKLNENSCLMITIDYSISSIEAFTNHIGFILDEKWCKFESKNFYDQIKRLLNILSKKCVCEKKCSLKNIKDDSDFKKLRTLRNKIHHVHASEDDYYDDEKNEDIDYEAIWVNPTLDDAKFITTLTKEIIQEVYLCLSEQSKNRIQIIKRIRDREKLLSDFIQNPFKPSMHTKSRMVSPEHSVS